MTRIEKELRRAVSRAVTKFKRKRAKPLIVGKPVKARVTFLVSHFADVAELLPTVKRLDGLKVEYSAKDMIEAYKTFELLALVAYGMSSILTNLS